MTKIGSVILLIAFSSSLFAQETHAAINIVFRGPNGDHLVNECKAVEHLNLDKMAAPQDDLSKIGTCLGFIDGVIDHEILNTTDGNGRAAGRRFCVPNEASGAQLAKVVVKYGGDHPQELHFPGAAIVVLAMKDAFPCQ